MQRYCPRCMKLVEVGSQEFVLNNCKYIHDYCYECGVTIVSYKDSLDLSSLLEGENKKGEDNGKT